MEKKLISFEQLYKNCKHCSKVYLRTENGLNKEVAAQECKATASEYRCIINDNYYCNEEVCPIWCRSIISENEESYSKGLINLVSSTPIDRPPSKRAWIKILNHIMGKNKITHKKGHKMKVFTTLLGLLYAVQAGVRMFLKKIGRGSIC